ncbi:MAG: 5-histidylcysteine sulfoxide synthase [Chitinophagaceae bacterium]|nr:5-histidylcysteine sulfoxide synthase [Oligoflexus sp.]
MRSVGVISFSDSHFVKNYQGTIRLSLSAAYFQEFSDMSSNLTRNPNLDLNSTAKLSGSGEGEAWRKNIVRNSVSFPRNDDWWTGPNPLEARKKKPYADGRITALPIPNLQTCTRAELQAYFDNGWMLTELLFACLVDEEGFYRPPYHNLRHPLIFYYTHPAVLYINKLHVAGLIGTTIHPYHERLFETGVDEMSWDDLSKNEMEWPDLEHSYNYRKQTYQIVSKVIATHPGLADGHAPITPESPLWALVMSFEHERIHLETSSVLIRELPANIIKRHPGFPDLHPSAKPYDLHAAWKAPISGQDYPANPWVNLKARTITIGKDLAFPTFGWDNEYGHREANVKDFAATRQLTSNGEFYEFVKDGGYRDQKFWTEEGWRWRTFRNVKWPSFWVPVGPQGAHQFALRSCFEIVAMAWDWPVIANYHEAKAYAAWRNHKEKRVCPLRLMTEAEHHAVRSVEATGNTPDDVSRAFSVIERPTVNSSLRWGSEGPVNGRPEEEFADVFGNVWQWLEDHFHFLPGFQVHTLYDDFSTPCFDGLHQMIMGGSFVSAGDEATVHARFHFRPHFGQHAGFRLVDPLVPGNNGAVQIIEPVDDGLKDETKTRAQQIFAAFSQDDELLIEAMISREKLDRNVFPSLVKKYVSKHLNAQSRVLEVGSGVGALSYRLAEMGYKTIGSDISKLAIDTAKEWHKVGYVECLNPDTGEPMAIPLDRDACQRLEWRQTDASSLPAEWFDFDFVVLNRVLSQLPSPKGLLGRLSGERGLVKPGAYVLIADRFAWSERSTPKTLWLDATQVGEALGGHFKKIEEGSCFHVERPSKDLAAVGRLQFSLWRRES